MHHGDSPSPLPEELGRKLTGQDAHLGATGRFPEGKLIAHDEGEIQFSVGLHQGKVVLDFGKSVAWVGMSGNQAIDLGNVLLKWGRRANSTVWDGNG